MCVCDLKASGQHAKDRVRHHFLYVIAHARVGSKRRESRLFRYQVFRYELNTSRERETGEGEGGGQGGEGEGAGAGVRESERG